jgi:hypothetical protein
MLNQVKQDPKTNETIVPDLYEELVQDIEYAVSSLIRKMILEAQAKGDTHPIGLKFKADGNDYDIVISNRVLRNGFNSSIEQVLNHLDDQASY